MTETALDASINHRYSTPLEALEACWEDHRASERAGTPPDLLAMGGCRFARPGFFDYSAGYEAPFGRVGDGCAVAFRDLTHELQILIAPSATRAWYTRAMLEKAGKVVADEFRPRARALFSSTWKRRTMPVRDLFGHVMTEWAIHHAWPSENWQRGYHDFFLPGEYRGGYTRLAKPEHEAELNDGNDSLDPPVIFLDGEIHKHAILYAAALLRFRPGGTVRVLEGTSGPDDPLVLPPEPFGRDKVDGALRMSPDPDPSIPFLDGKSDVSAEARLAWRAPRAPGGFLLWLDRMGMRCLDFLDVLFPPRQQMSDEELMAYWGKLHLEYDERHLEEERRRTIEWTIDDDFVYGGPSTRVLPPSIPIRRDAATGA